MKISKGSSYDNRSVLLIKLFQSKTKLTMASNFPKLPGFVVTHNPCMVNHKKMSHVKLDQVRNGNNVDVPLYAVPLQPSNAKFTAEKTDMSKSMSQKQYVNHQGTNIDEQYEPNFVKLDKQVITHPHIFHK